MSKTEQELTPMKRQYKLIKEQHKDCLLFFRLGDFYEMFDDDARTAARELDLTLTTRDRNKPKEEQTPMCGVPFHSVDSYISRLVQKGYKIAICEQVEDPAAAKGLVDRDITRIVTPGTVTESCMLQEDRNNYIACIVSPRDRVGLAFCDVSTGAFYATSCADAEAASSELGRFSPSEVFRIGPGTHGKVLDDTLQLRIRCLVNDKLSAACDEDQAAELVERHFSAPLSQLGLMGQPEAVHACGALLRQLMFVQKNDLPHIRQLQYYTSGRFMELDLNTRRNLELTQSMRSGEKKGTLLWVLDKTVTSMGGRTLRSWVEKPLLSLPQIDQRHTAVEELANDPILLGELRQALKGVTDMERVMARVATNSVNCRDLLGLAQGLRALPRILELLENARSPMLAKLFKAMDPLQDCASLLEKSFLDDPPITLREGGIVRPGADPDVDNLRDLVAGGQSVIATIEAKEKRRTGIRTLRVGFNRVFGYYIEVSKSFVGQVPQDYIRKQTLANCERYITPELKELEGQVLSAKERLLSAEYEFFLRIRNYVSLQTRRIQPTAIAVAAVDCLCSLAFVAVNQGYCRPEMTSGDELVITEGRHPVVERMLRESLFVPNDTVLGGTDHMVSIITGPNMAGKSTYMRQVALIVLMAQMGSFVPARTARLGLVDRVFTRIGASDDLSAGQSTFMVEMAEVATILKHATTKSLLILDEIGRGTSTYDGMSIARAVLEYAANPRRLGAKTLFATHYHELSVLERELSNVKNYNIAVKKRGDQMIFLRKIVPGSTDDSFGVEVAKLAGIPGSVITRAREILSQLESGSHTAPREAPEPADQVSLEDLRFGQVADALRQISVETLTPIEAMNELYRLRKMLN